MNEIRQTFDEADFKPRNVEQKAIKTFNITLVRRLPILYLFSFSVSLIILLFAAGIFYPDERKVLLSSALLILAIFLSLLFYFINALTEQEIIELYDDKLVIKHHNTTVINFADILNYQVIYYNGVTIRLKLKDGKTKGLSAGANKGMEDFFIAFDSKMKELTSSKQLSVTRKKSFLESKFYIGFLIVATVVYVVMTIVGIIKWGHLPPARIWFYYLYPIGGWVAYLRARSLSKKEI